MAEEQLIEKYKQLEYILHLDSGWVIGDVFRNIGAGAIFILTFLSSFLEQIIDKVVTLNDFYAIKPIAELMMVLRPYIWGLFLIAIIILGIQFMLNKVERRNEIMLNIILAVVIIVVIPDIMTNLKSLTDVGIEQINPEQSTLASEMVKSNVADVLYYAKNDFSFASNKEGNNGTPPLPASKEDSQIGTTDFTYANQLSLKTISYLPYTQKLDSHIQADWYSKLSEEGQQLLSHKLVLTGEGEKFEIESLAKNMVPMTEMGRESYYRYHVNWGVLLISLLVTTVALIITIIKIGRAVFDLAFHQLFGMFVAVTDLTGGQRIKKVLIEIVNTFAIIFIMMVLLKLFLFYSTWANGLKVDIGSIGVVLLLIAGTWALIDAPDIVQRMLGIDAGLRSGYQALAGSYASTRLAGSATKGVQKGATLLAKGTAVGALGTSNFIRRTAQGIQQPIEKTKSQQSTAKGENISSNNTSATSSPTAVKKSIENNIVPLTKRTDDGVKNKTMIMGTRTAQDIRNTVKRAGNSGYALGQSIRKVGEKTIQKNRPLRSNDKQIKVEK